MRTIRTKVAGVTHKNKDGTSRQEILKRMLNESCEGDAVFLEREPDNEYDGNAIKVLNGDWEQIGYLKRELASELAKKMDAGKTYEAEILNFIDDSENNSVIGCNLKITEEDTSEIKPEQPKTQETTSLEIEKKSEIKNKKGSFGKNVLKFFIGFTVLAMIANVISPREKVTERSAKKDVQTLSQVEKAPKKEWYELGTLHRATIAEWKKATPSDKLATCADFLAGLWKEDLLKIKIADMSELKKYAQELEQFIDTATDGHEVTDKEAVSDIAVNGVIMMDWYKKTEDKK